MFLLFSCQSVPGSTTASRTKMEQIKQRDSYIDVVKGLALLSIMLIHTVFWSGATYVPYYCRNIVLCFDVPIFFVLSGMGVACNGGKISFPSMFFKFSLAFGMLTFFADLFSGNFTFSTCARYLLIPSEAPPIPLLFNAHSSYWFVPMFILSMAIFSVIITFFRHLGIGMAALLLLYYPIRMLCQLPALSQIPICNFLSAYDLYSTRFFCYTAFLLIGYYSYPYLDSLRKRLYISSSIAGLGVLILMVSLLVLGWKGSDFNQNKLPPNCSYIGISLVSISLVLLCYNRNVRSFFLSHIGKNAIWFFAGQCVGGSTLFNIAPHCKCIWEIKLVLMFLCNILISTLAAEVFRAIYQLIIRLKIIRLSERQSVPQA